MTYLFFSVLDFKYYLVELRDLLLKIHTNIRKSVSFYHPHLLLEPQVTLEADQTLGLWVPEPCHTEKVNKL